jgi:predicted negative regulator of RcsB-dependent stress response
VAGVVLASGFIAYQQHQVSERRELAQGLAQVSQLATETSVDSLENFEAIQRLDQAPHDTDGGLIAALQ